MEIFDIKRGNYPKIEGDKLFGLMEQVFGNCEREGDWFVSRYGAMQPIKARAFSTKEVQIEIVTVKIPEDQVMDTMRKRNMFLEMATGFDSKERLKRLKKKAQGSDY